MTAEVPSDGLRLDEPLDEGEVLISTGLGTKSIFHVDRDCPQLEHVSSGRRATREALYPIYRACETCGDGTSDERRGHAKIDECPRCGDDIPQLSTHLQYCDGVVADD